MFGMGMGEIVIILVLALILLGPQKLPEAAQKLGKGLREFRKATQDIREQFEREVGDVAGLDGKARPAPTSTSPRQAPVAAPGAVAGTETASDEAVWKGAAPRASLRNVPGLEAALAEPLPPAAPTSTSDVG
jgi:sec-independent protein translocase protein TatB